MTKLTLTKIGSTKTINTVHGEKQKGWLQAQEYGGQFLNYWINGTTKNWKVGDVVEVEAVEEQKYISKKDGLEKTSMEIKLPKFNGGNNGEVMAKLNSQGIQIEIIGKMVKALYADMLKRNGQDKTKIAGTDIDYPMPEDEGLDRDNMANF